MKYDIRAYNEDAEKAQEQMLLFNIGQLSYERPPQFMMLQEIDQTRTFSGSGSFQWTDLTDSFFHLFGTTPATSVTANGAETYQVGPFATSAVESPTIKFLPVQGADFFQRLESSERDKFSFFLEEQRWHASSEEREWFTSLMADGMVIYRGNADCPAGRYVNGFRDPNRPEPSSIFYFDQFERCIHYITHYNRLNYQMLYGTHLVNTAAGEAPKAADVLAALAAGYVWTSTDSPGTVSNESTRAKTKTSIKKTTGTTIEQSTESVEPPRQFMLANDVKMPAWLSWPLQAGQLNVDSIVNEVWPVANDYFYVQLRDDHGAQSACDPNTGTPDYSSPVVCGYVKIATLFEIMHRFGQMARVCEDNPQYRRECIFGIGNSAPSWADSAATFSTRSRFGRNVYKEVWVPAQDPREKDNSYVVDRDRYMFLMLYKLYQTSLVDTSKLVTGTTPITISK